MPDTSKETKKDETSSKPLTDEERRKDEPSLFEKSEKTGVESEE